ncbi:hypothetical protein [Gordonia sp. CPCC 205333]|uniref:hypothetical protein n=1 Tax=Gordonia sp. CPCC 205333 TaxID=3140790 RepID=UPI003AF35C52
MAGDPAIRHRIDTVPGLAGLADGIDTSDIARCLLMVSIACADVTAIGAEPVVAEAFNQWRCGAGVSEPMRTALDELVANADVLAADRRHDQANRDVAFRRARALTCLHLASAASVDQPSAVLREVLRESAYEASHVLTSAGVVGVLKPFVASESR